MFNHKFLKRIREKNNITRSGLVFELDKVGLRISRPTLINWETGATEPKISQAYLVSKYFGIPVDEFIAI